MAVPVLLSLTLHEYGHARAALAFGDKTALIQGRVTLNPLAHLDPIGTIGLLFGPIGWAKPVPVDYSRLNPARIGDICVSLAGVGMNLLLAVGCLITLNVLGSIGISLPVDMDAPLRPQEIAVCMLYYGLTINLSLMLFNIIPLFPLDGHHVLRELLPWEQRYHYMEWQVQYGRYVLYGLIGLPWLLKMVGANVYFNPIGTYMSHVINPLLSTCLSSKADVLIGSTLSHLHPYLLW